MTRTKVAVIVVVLILLVFVNFFLSRNKLFFYATGTKEQAFANTTWLMSENEVERAIEAKLQPTEPADIINPDAPMWHTYKIRWSSGTRAYGQRTIANYFFNEDKLFAVIVDLRIPRKDVPLHTLDSLVLFDLEQNYGRPSVAQVDSNDSFYSWSTRNQLIRYAARKRDQVSAYVNIIYEPYRASWDSLRGKFSYTLYSKPPTLDESTSTDSLR